jgi:transposase
MGARGRPKALLVLSDEERRTLERWARRPKSAQALALRCRIVLACAQGTTNNEVAARLGVNQATVCKWRGRFVARRLDGLSDDPRPGAPRTVTDEDVERVIVTTLEQTPLDATHWSTRSLAKATGMSQSGVSRLWRAFGLKPHLTEAFKLSTDPEFIDKPRHRRALPQPPEGALVLCVDEKSQIQALDRTAPVLPLLPGTPERQTHDYVRHGTTNLYAALDVVSGNVIADLTDQHRAIEFLQFLNLINRSVPADLDVHVIVDNSSSHKPPEIHRWLLRLPPVHAALHAHLQLLAESRRKLVPRTHREMAPRGTHRSTKELVGAIRSWITTWNDNPRPFVWRKTADEILDSVAAYCERISDSGHWERADFLAISSRSSRGTGRITSNTRQFCLVGDSVALLLRWQTPERCSSARS